MLFQVVAVHVLACLDVPGRQADVLAVLDDGLAFGDVAGSQLVIDGDVLRRSQALLLARAHVGDGLALLHGLDGDHHVVHGLNDHAVQHNVILLSFLNEYV